MRWKNCSTHDGEELLHAWCAACGDVEERRFSAASTLQKLTGLQPQWTSFAEAPPPSLK
jgi:hypothetical protein